MSDSIQLYVLNDKKARKGEVMADNKDLTAVLPDGTRVLIKGG